MTNLQIVWRNPQPIPLIDKVDAPITAYYRPERFNESPRVFEMLYNAANRIADEFEIGGGK